MTCVIRQGTIFSGKQTPDFDIDEIDRPDTEYQLATLLIYFSLLVP